MPKYWLAMEDDIYTKFQGNQPSGSGEEDFLRFLPHMGMVAILVM